MVDLIGGIDLIKSKSWPVQIPIVHTRVRAWLARLPIQYVEEDKLNYVGRG